MKRADLTPGMDVYWCRNRNWLDFTYGARRAVVVAVEPYEQPTNDLGRFGKVDAGKPRRVESGTGVLVDLYPPRGAYHTQTSREVVPLSQLRGPYAEALALVEAAEKARREAADRKLSQQNATLDQLTQLVARARTLGIRCGYQTSPAHILLSPDGFEDLLNRLEAGQ